ncbi:MAG: hypothetical protein ACREBV_03870 [Candidatus Zixiibacteriota bacterium]
MKKPSNKTGAIACGLLVTTFFIFAAIPLSAQEHPEHPSKDQPKKEDPEHPSKDAAAAVTVDQMAMAITDYVNSDAKLKGGFFFVYDATSKKPLQLTLDKVHKERLSQVGENLFFACSDFKDPAGKVYDLDFFMQSVDGKLTVSEVIIHKEEGKPRYQWSEENGLWKRK